jgi:hypothetical protein
MLVHKNIYVLFGRTSTVSWTIQPAHSVVIWLYQYSILNNTAISCSCYLAVPVQYPEQYSHLIQLLSGRTSTVSWTIWPSHSGVIWPYRYSILNNTAISFRCKIWSKQQSVTIFLSKSNDTIKVLMKIFHVSQNPKVARSISRHASETMFKHFFFPVH